MVNMSHGVAVATVATRYLSEGILHMSTYDLVIKNGTVIDGLRTPRYKADIGVKDGKIARDRPISPRKPLIG